MAPTCLRAVAMVPNRRPRRATAPGAAARRRRAPRRPRRGAASSTRPCACRRGSPRACAHTRLAARGPGRPVADGVAASCRLAPPAPTSGSACVCVCDTRGPSLERLAGLETGGAVAQPGGGNTCVATQELLVQAPVNQILCCNPSSPPSRRPALRMAHIRTPRSALVDIGARGQSSPPGPNDDESWRNRHRARSPNLPSKVPGASMGVWPHGEGAGFGLQDGMRLTEAGEASKSSAAARVDPHMCKRVAASPLDQVFQIQRRSL